jgi:ferredoxin
MSKERKRSLKELAKVMNKRHQTPLPINQPLLDCFDLFITPEEVNFLLRMGTNPYTHGELAGLSEMPAEPFESFLATLLEKGLIWTERANDGNRRYRLAGIMLGWFEVVLSDGQETPEKKEFARRIEELFNSWGRMNLFPLRNLLNLKERRKEPRQGIINYAEAAGSTGRTTIPINETLKTSSAAVFQTTTVLELIEKHGDENKIALVHCFCRQQRKMMDDPCRLDFPAEACIVIGKYAEYFVDYGVGRYVSKDEALEIVNTVRKKGAVHQTFHEEEDTGHPEIAICNCCWDCCGVLGSYNRGVMPLHFKSYYMANISDDSLCNGCGTCEGHCPVQAITLRGETADIAVERCIGCGQCEFQCPEGAVAMIRQEREVMLPLKKRSQARIQIH